jgi:hypothetical protein
LNIIFLGNGGDFLLKNIEYKLLSIIFILNIFGIFVIDGDTVSATTPTEERYFDYTISDGKAIITYFTGNLEGVYDVVIPNTLGGFPVTIIGEYAFLFAPITSVIIPNTVLEIQGNAFNSTELTSIIIPETVTTIGISAFEGSRITSVTIPEGVTTIMDRAFRNNELMNVKFNSSNATLGADVFASNQITPSNLIIEGYNGSTIESYASLEGFTFLVLPEPVEDLLENSMMKTSVLPGVMAISSFPSTLSFESYDISLNKPLLHLQSPFELSIDDFTGSYAGWDLSISITELADGSTKLKNPYLMINLTNLVINDADDNGLESEFDTSPLGTFTKTDGISSFGISKKIVSGQINNPAATTRHYFNFPTDSLEIGFDNTTKAGTFTGTTTFALTASP